MKNIILISTLLLLAMGFNAHADSRYYDPAEVLALDPAPPPGVTWYVDGTNGSDNNDGMTVGHAFKTIGKALDRYAGRHYGDRVLIKAGTYKTSNIGPANLVGTGSDNNRFMIGPYGDGEVIIDCSETVTWTVYSGNVYECTLGANVTCDSIIMDDNYKSCRPVAQLADVDTDGEWFQSGTTLYLYSGTGAPSSRNAMVRRADWDNTIYGFYVVDVSYITLYGMTVLSAPAIGIMFYNSSYDRVEKCKIKYCGKNAITMPWGEHLQVVNSYIYANCMMNWPRGSKWGSTGGWPTGVNIGSYGTIQGCIVAETGGEGINMYGGGSSPLLIQDNIVYNNYSVNIYVDSHPNATIRRNFVYCNGIDTNDIIATPPSGSTTTSIARRLRPIGIMIGDETAAGGGATDESIYDNIILGCKYGISRYSQAAGSGWIRHYVYNNTIILPNYDSTPISDTFYGIKLDASANNIGSEVKDNMVIGTEAHGKLICWGVEDYPGIVVDNNLYYHPNNSTPFQFDSNNYSFTDWKAQSGQDANSLNQNPLLNRTDWTFVTNSGTPSSLIDNPYCLAIIRVDLNDFFPQANSPAIDTGADLENQYGDDYILTYRPQGKAWDMGAFEYTDSVTVPPPSGPPAPVPDFSGSPTTGTSPLTVQFTDQSIGSVTSYLWDFGDTQTSTAQSPSHIYASAGDYTVSLTVTGAGESNVNTRTNYINVTQPPPPPVANFTGRPTRGTSPLTVRFTSQSTGTITGYLWNFGDNQTSTTKSPSHRYSSPGYYTVTLTVTGPGGFNAKTGTNYVYVTRRRH